MISLIDTIYDTFLKVSGRGSQYDVDIHVPGNDNPDSIAVHKVTVWARDEEEADERALKAFSIEYFAKQTSIEEKSLGTLLGKETYRPRTTLSAITAPLKIWRDPLYKRSSKSLKSSSTLPIGTFTKASIASLNSSKAQRKTATVATSRRQLVRALNLNVIALFAWSAIVIIGFSMGIATLIGYGNSSIIWVATKTITFVFCLVTGSLGVLTAVRNIRTLNAALAENSEDN